MPRLFAVLLIALCCTGLSLAERTVRSTTPLPGDAQVDSIPSEITIKNVVLQCQGTDVILSWKPLLNTHPDNESRLTGYYVYSGPNLDRLQRIATTPLSSFRLRGAQNFRNRFYRVTGYFDGDRRQQLPRRLRRDGLVILDFEEDLELEPYSEEEDREPDWGITDQETLPESEHSLRVGGNSWQRLRFDRTILTDTTVWSIGVLSENNQNRIQDLHAFGIGDGSRELFYVFSGSRLNWNHNWVVANQDAYPRGEWHVFKLAVGYDWKIRYGYLPSIDELYFISDNDNNDRPLSVYFDELSDLTTTILPDPQPKVRWRDQPDLEINGYPISFTCDVDNRDAEDLASYYWDFGDGHESSLPQPTHVYQVEGNFTASVTVEDQDGRIGSEIARVEVGRIRTPQLISACFTGDVMLARRYEADGGWIREQGPEIVFEKIRSRLMRSDLNVINLESLLTDEGIRHASKTIVFRGSPENVAGLVYAGIDVALLANNHVIDYGARGLEETIEVLDAAGIVHSGAGANEYEALKPTFKTVRGIRVGFLSYCNRTGRDYNLRPFLDAGYDRYGYAYFSADNILRSVPAAAEDCDLLVIYVHGGWEYETAPTGAGQEDLINPQTGELGFYIPQVDSATRELEQMAIDLGAGLVIGHHPHVLQGFEVYRGKVIAHSMGNFAFDQNFFETWPSALVSAEISHDGVEQIWVEPVFVDLYRPTPAVGTLGRKILDRLCGYSYDLATLVPEYHRMRARIVTEPQRVTHSEEEHSFTAQMRYLEEEDVYRSQPIKLSGGGFPSQIVRIEPEVPDPGWRVSMGRDILLVGNMELEGADIWNFNSDNEQRDDQIVHQGTFSSHLTRMQGWRDGITDLTQRIPVDWEHDRLTFGGWLRITNGQDAALAVRLYSDRYEDRRVGEDQVAEGRFQGDLPWTYVWDQVDLPETSQYLNIRWQLFGAQVGQNHIWADDVEVIRWEEFTEFEGDLGVDFPNDLYYLQIETRRPVDTVTVTYRTATLEIR